MYEIFVGDDPKKVPMQIFPDSSLHDGRTLGRLPSDDISSWDFSPPANVITSTMGPIGWAEMGWRLAHLPVILPGRSAVEYCKSLSKEFGRGFQPRSIEAEKKRCEELDQRIRG